MEKAKVVPKYMLLWSSKDLLIRILLIILLISYFFLTAYVMFSRLQYPYQLEWMEGGEVEHIQRLLDGKKIYCEPSMEFIPYIYTPFYYYIGVGLSIFDEPSLHTMRVISIVSFLLSLFFTYKIVFFVTRNKFWSLIGSGIFLLSYSNTGFWYDIARVDTTANLFLIISLYLLVKADNNKWNWFFSSLFSFLAFYTKQTYFPVTFFLIISLFFKNKKLAWKFSSLYFGLIALTTLIETMQSNGWYIFWNFYFPSLHHWIWERAITFWTIDILPYYSIALATIFAYLFIIFHHSSKEKGLLLYALFIGCFITSYLSRLHYGGYLNVLIPFVTSMSILFPVSMSSLSKMLGVGKNIGLICLVFVSVQIFSLLNNPTHSIPTLNDKNAVEKIFSFAKNSGGDIYLMGYNYVQKQFGLKSYPHYVLLNDMFISKVQYKDKVIQELESMLKAKKFKGILLDESLNLDLLDKYYQKTNISFYHRVFNSKQSPLRQEVLWVPKTK
ncbi:MAG: ArnT family glycosyltransferase [Candidatus Kapaibacteriota bacterium]